MANLHEVIEQMQSRILELEHEDKSNKEDILFSLREIEKLKKDLISTHSAIDNILKIIEKQNNILDAIFVVLNK